MEPLSRVVESHRVESVLFVLSRFSRFAGPAMIALDVARTFARHGVRSTIAAMGAKPEFRDAAEAGLEVIDMRRDPRGLVGRPFDVVITQAWQPACMALLECGVVFRRLVVGSFSMFLPGEAIFGLEAEADALLFHSRRNLEGQAPSLAPGAPRLNYNNALPEPWFDGERKPVCTLHRILVVSNHLCSELRDAERHWSALGYEVTLVGAEVGQREVTPALIDASDVVVTIGHTVQKALVRGTPVFCYDHFGGPGYIDLENAQQAEYDGYSGRGSEPRSSSDELVERVVTGFARAAMHVEALRAWARPRYRLDTVLGRALGPGPWRDPRSLRVPALRGLRKVFQLSDSHNPKGTAFTRNLMLDEEAPPSVACLSFQRARDPRVRTVRMALLPPALFTSRIPSDVEVRLQVELCDLAGDDGVEAIDVLGGARVTRVGRDELRVVRGPASADERGPATLIGRVPLSIDTQTQRLELFVHDGEGRIPIGSVTLDRSGTRARAS